MRIQNKNLATLILVTILTTIVSADDNNATNHDVSFRAMPILSSNPTSGTGVGATGMMIYKVDPDSSPSQTILTGQYTSSKSYNAFAVNKMYFGGDDFQSNTVVGMLFNNSAFDISGLVSELLPIEPSSEINAEFDVTIFVAAEQFLYRVKDHVYLGGQLFYVNQVFNAQNPAGTLFLKSSGTTDSSRLGFGVTYSYDTRSKREKFYPRDAQWMTLMANDFPSQWGSGDHYYNVIFNARDYMHGFKEDDVVATQLFVQYSSEDTPDGALAALGSRSILRGFVIGQYKARNMIALQSEYRYDITNTDFRLAAFGGYANLNGGSKGTDYGDRDRDNGHYYSGGVGVRYTIQEEQGIDYRIDFAATNTHDYGIYANINQAF
jgi:hypothetical protein